MKDISIIIPLHIFNETVVDFLEKALYSVDKNIENYNGYINTVVVAPGDVCRQVNDFVSNHEKLQHFSDNLNYVVNETEYTDYCSQVNLAAEKVETKYFSILEFDDEYTPKWFKMASEYMDYYEDVSVFLPLNIHYDHEKKNWQYCNEMVLATSFSNEIGFIDYDCLQNCSIFNLTGGIFNHEDFIKVGGFKKSVQVSFNYEFLLRITNKGLKVYVVPKEGYKHMVGRKHSIVDLNDKLYNDDEIQKWFDLAKREHVYDEDRGKTIVSDNVETVK